MPGDPPLLLPLESTLDGVLGFEVVEVGAERVRGQVAVENRVKQPLGLVHGGVYAALAESLCSMATHASVFEGGNVAVGLSNHTSFLRPVTEGTVHADGRRRHGGRTTWVWEVEFTDDDGKVCALSRVTMAVRPAPS